MIPFNHTEYVYIENDSVVSFGPPAPGGQAYSGGVLAPNGKIYLIPRDNGAYRFIDTTTNTVGVFGPASPGANAFTGGALAANGRIYLAPRGIGLRQAEPLYKFDNLNAARGGVGGVAAMRWQRVRTSGLTNAATRRKVRPVCSFSAP